jgi:hypothetical protein
MPCSGKEIRRHARDKRRQARAQANRRWHKRSKRPDPISNS